MSFDYLALAGEYDETADVSVPNGCDPTVYEQLVWVSTPIAKATLEAFTIPPEPVPGTVSAVAAEYRTSGSLSLNSAGKHVEFPSVSLSHADVLVENNDIFTLNRVGIWEVTIYWNLHKNFVLFGGDTTVTAQIDLDTGSGFNIILGSEDQLKLWNTGDEGDCVSDSLIHVTSLNTFEIRGFIKADGGSQKYLDTESEIILKYLGTV